MKKMIKKTSALAISAFMLAQYIPFSAMAATDSTHCDLTIHPYRVTDTTKSGLASPADAPTGTTGDATRAGTNGTAIADGTMNFSVIRVNADGSAYTGAVAQTIASGGTLASLEDGYYKIDPQDSTTDDNFAGSDAFIIQIPVTSASGNVRDVHIYPKLTDNENGTDDPTGYDPTVDLHTIQLIKTLSDPDDSMSASKKASFDAFYLDADQKTWVNTGHTYTTDADGKVTIDGLPYGTYYLVETAAPAGYMIDKTPIKFTIDGTSGNNQVTVENEKILGVDKEIAYDAAGNTYNWVIKGDIPDDPSKLSAYAITDTYSASALENVAVSSVKVGNTDLALTADYTVTTGDGTLTITFTPAGLLKLDKNGTVTTVDVTVSSTIVSGYSSASVSNSASIAYTYGATSTGPVISPTPAPENYPTTPADPAIPTEDTKEVTLATLIISNTGSGELAGATYKLEKADGTAISDAFNTLTDDSMLAAPNKDKVVVANLAPGAYKITQTGIGSAASDHLLNDTPRLIYVGDDGNIYESDKTTLIADGGVSNQVQFVNTAKGAFNLPFTGTTATIIFTITGILLMAGTGFLIFMILKKRDDDEEDEEQVNN